MPKFRPVPGLAALLICAVLLSGCGRKPQSRDAEASETIIQELPAIPAADPPLDREQLLLASIRAASAFAAGKQGPLVQRELDGKRFELRMRFGCDDGTNAERGWRFDAEERTLRLQVTPDISKRDPIAAMIAGEQYESVEGFWFRKPWLLTSVCPKAPGRASPTPPVEATKAKSGPKGPGNIGPMITAPQIGVAQFSTLTDSRTTRRDGRPYEATKVLVEGRKPSQQGYDFVISGRLRALPGAGVIPCAGGTADQPPSCIISVHVDSAWIEDPETQDMIAQWNDG